MQWKKLVRKWSKVVNVKPNLIANAVIVKSLQGEARSLALSIDDDKLETDTGLEVLITELDSLFEKDKDSCGYDAWKKCISFKDI